MDVPPSPKSHCQLIGPFVETSVKATGAFKAGVVVLALKAATTGVEPVSYTHLTLPTSDLV